MSAGTSIKGPIIAGHLVTSNHTITQKGTYIIKAKAKDV